MWYADITIGLGDEKPKTKKEEIIRIKSAVDAGRFRYSIRSF